MVTRRLLLSSVAAAAVTAAAAGRARAQSPELAVIVHPEVAVSVLKAGELAAIYTASMRKWSDGKGVVPFNAAAKSELRVLFDEVVLQMSPDQSSRFWIDAQIRGNGHPPRQTTDARLAVRLVARLQGAIAYVPAALVDGTVKVVARIKDRKLVAP